MKIQSPSHMVKKYLLKSSNWNPQSCLYFFLNHINRTHDNKNGRPKQRFLLYVYEALQKTLTLR